MTYKTISILLLLCVIFFSCKKDNTPDNPIETAIEAIQGTYSGITLKIEVVNSEGYDTLTATGNGIFTETIDTSYITHLELVISDPTLDSTIEVSYNNHDYSFIYNVSGAYSVSEQAGAYATRTFSMEIFGLGDSVKVWEHWRDTKAGMAPANWTTKDMVGKK